jgi:ubiquinone/menaquinone biosynthesis C-methylase UbiE
MAKTFQTNYNLSDPAIVSTIDDLPLWSAPFGLKLLDTIKYRKNLKALDIGSGNGFPAVELASRLGNTCEVFGIDPWKEANERVKQKIAVWGITNLKIIKGEAESLPFEDNYFDLITANNGINNINNENDVWSELSRVAKPGCQFVFTVNLPESFIEFYNLYKFVLEKNKLFEEVEKIDEHIHNKRKPLEHLLNLVEKNGFRTVKIIEDSFNFTYSDGTSMFNHFFIKLAFMESWLKILPGEKTEPVFAELEKGLNEYAAAQGCLKLLIPFACIDTIKIK